MVEISEQQADSEHTVALRFAYDTHIRSLAITNSQSFLKQTAKKWLS